MEFVFNDCIKAESEVIQIHAGTYVVLPADVCMDELDRLETENDEVNFDSPTFPDEIPALFPHFPHYLLVCAGQSLKREDYPGWSSPYPGGFYTFDLPDLRGKFILGFDQDTQPVKGTGCVYYKDVPEIPAPPPRDIRDMP